MRAEFSGLAATRSLVATAAALLACGAVDREPAPEPGPDRPSFVLIVIDTLRTDQLSSRMLDGRLSRLTAGPPRPHPEIDEETRERLRELGYVE